MNLKKSLNSNTIKTLHFKNSRFHEMLVEENTLDQNGFKRWIFCHGMMFNSPDKWWGNRGLRDYPHEGIDLCLYEDQANRIHCINEKMRIPVMHDGVVKAIFRDYLGKSVIIEHEHSGSDTGRFISFYAHTKPLSEIENGMVVKEGYIIATLPDTDNSKSNIIPHLHFSLGIPSRSFSYDGFVWNTIRNPEMITLLDPLANIDWPYQELGAGNAFCREFDGLISPEKS